MAKDAIVEDPRGLKRICLSCSTRFFDLNKRPIICPQCGIEFTGEVKIKSRRGRLAADDTADEGQVTAKTEVDEEDEDLIEEEEAQTVSLEEVEELDDDSDDDAASKLDDSLDTDLDDDLVDEEIEDLDDDEDLDVDTDEDK